MTDQQDRHTPIARKAVAEVNEVTLQHSIDAIEVFVTRHTGVKCERCWKRGDFNPKTQLCFRCINALIDWAKRTGLADEVAQAIKDKTPLSNRKLYGVILANADLRGMDFSNSIMPVDCFRSDFRGCNLEGTDFSRSLTMQSIFDHRYDVGAGVSDTALQTEDGGDDLPPAPPPTP